MEGENTYSELNGRRDVCDEERLLYVIDEEVECVFILIDFQFNSGARVEWRNLMGWCVC